MEPTPGGALVEAKTPRRITTGELVFGPPGAPLDWALTCWTFAAVLVGAAISYAAGHPDWTLFVAIPCLLAGIVAATAEEAGVPRRALAFSTLIAVLQALAVGVAYNPVLAGLTLGIITFLATAITVVPRWKVAGSMLATGYLLTALLGFRFGVLTRTPTATALVLGLLGALIGTATVLVVGWARTRLRPVRSAGDTPAPASAPHIWPAWHAVTHVRDPRVQFAAVRGVIGGVGLWACVVGIRVGGITLDPNDINACWILLAAFLTLQPTSVRTLENGLLRVGGTALAVVVWGVLAAMLPLAIARWIGLAALLIGLLFIQRSQIMANFGITMFVVALLGGAHGDYLSWALLRLVDVGVGGGIAVVAGFVVLPMLHLAAGGGYRRAEPPPLPIVPEDPADETDAAPESASSSGGDAAIADDAEVSPAS